MTDDLAFASLREHRRLLRRGSLSARELVESCLRRIESIDGGLGAFEAMDADRALREADSAQAALMAADITRPLLGMPVAVKAPPGHAIFAGAGRRARHPGARDLGSRRPSMADRSRGRLSRARQRADPPLGGAGHTP